MTTYPHEAGEAEPFVPASLAHLENPPTFYLRWGTPREKSEYRSILRREGRIQHSQEEHRDAVLAGMRALFSPEDVERWEPLTKEWWDAIDSHLKDLAEARQALPENPSEADLESLPKFVFEGDDLIKETLERISLDWPRCRILRDDDLRWAEDEPYAVNAVIITQIENLDIELVRERGSKYLAFDCAAAINEALYWAGRDGGIDEPGKAVAELNRECQLKLFLGKRRAKNSDSPAPSDLTPDTSKTGAGETSGKSKGSARSRRTRAASSATTSGT